MNDEIGYASAPGALVMDTRKSVSGGKAVPSAAALTVLRVAAYELPGRVPDLRRRQPVGERVDELDVADRAFGLLDLLGHALVALAAQPTGHSTDVARPTFAFQSGDTLARKSVKM